ncbi:DUF6053 domain-containing protein [Lysobacter enzymogenes]|uniref:DUF6053 domain-containing protein n=1 Tax=Lysobacter enzymogenes TaxID=69 RepID=UPI001A966D64|nr:DUF6053 domain-containing protein [Lysobacter enzymogenes]QQP98103.1 hypothetical protein JHW38_08940 [Lysobacter enzymogenes]
MMSKAPFVAAFVSKLSAPVTVSIPVAVPVPVPLHGTAPTAALIEVPSMQMSMSAPTPTPTPMSVQMRGKANHTAFVRMPSVPPLLFQLSAIRPDSLGPENPPTKPGRPIRTGHRP